MFELYADRYVSGNRHFRRHSACFAAAFEYGGRGDRPFTDYIGVSGRHRRKGDERILFYFAAGYDVLSVGLCRDRASFACGKAYRISLYFRNRRRVAASRISAVTVGRIRARGKSAYCDEREQRLYKVSFECHKCLLEL